MLDALLPAERKLTVMIRTPKRRTSSANSETMSNTSLLNMWMMKYLAMVRRESRRNGGWNVLHQEHNEGKRGEAKLQAVGSLQNFMEAGRDGARFAA
jgi:hypothetical protein